MATRTTGSSPGNPPPWVEPPMTEQDKQDQAIVDRASRKSGDGINFTRRELEASARLRKRWGDNERSYQAYLERYFDSNGNPKSSTATEEAPAPRPAPRTEAENEGRIGTALGNSQAEQEKRANRLAGVLAGAGGPTQTRAPEEKAPEPVKARPRRQRPEPKPPAAEIKSSTPQPEPPEITADKEFLRKHDEANTITPTDPAQRAAGERIQAYEAQQKAESRAAQNAQAAARAGAPPASTGGTAGNTSTAQGTVASNTATPYAVDSKEYDDDWAVVIESLERDRLELPSTPAQKAESNAANDRIERAHLARLAANTEAAAQPRTAVAIPTNAYGSIAESDKNILDYYKAHPPDNDEDRALVKEIQDRVNGRNLEKLSEADPRVSGPVSAGADAQSSLVLPRVGDVPTLGELKLPPVDPTRLETDYTARGQADREREARLIAQREKTARLDAIEKEFQAAQAAENAKREAAAAGNKANWFEANRRINSTGFSGCDITALVRVPRRGRDGFDEERIFNIGTLQTISISTYNSKTPVRALGFKNPVSIARGGRTIAGTMIFNQLHTHVLDESEFGSLTSVLDKNGLLSYSSGVNVTIYDAKSVNTNGIIDPTTVKNRKKVWDFSWDTTLNRGQFQKPSDIIPFDIVIWMINESGGMGKIILYDIDIIHDSTTLSVEDIYTEVQYQYMARDIEYFEAYSIDQAYEWQGVTLPNVVTRKVMEEDIVDTTAENFGESA